MTDGEDEGLRPDAPGSPWRTVGAREMYRNPWLRVTEYQVIRPDGQPGIYGVVDPGDNVTIVALEDDERVWLVSEFLYPLQTAEWFLPTGAVERGEDILAAAQRELAEETGLRAAGVEWSLARIRLALASQRKPAISSWRVDCGTARLRLKERSRLRRVWRRCARR